MRRRRPPILALRTPAPRPTSPASRFLDAALAVGRELVAAAARGPHGLAWEGDDLAGEGAGVRVVRAATGPGLYSGAAGIGWFLAHLGAHSGDGALAAAGVSALGAALAECRAGGLGPSALSLHGGASGAALAALDGAAAVGDARLAARARALARATARAVLSGALPEERDLVGGLAGIVVALAAVHRRAPERLLADACRAAADRLVAVRREGPWGTAWADAHAPDAPALCGLAHGASGIIWALDEAAAVTGEPRHAEVAREALAFERSWFSQDPCGWPDLREAPADPEASGWPGLMCAWCHGAIGIGAVRLALWERSRAPDALAEAGAAVEAARRMLASAGAALVEGRHPDVTLCHGIGGAAELLSLAWEVTGVDDHLRAARRAGALCLDVGRARGGRFTTGLPGGEHVPGLMVGLAGVGAAMLRLHDSAAIGSPLLPGRPPRATVAAPLVAQVVERKTSGSA